ncbi:AraC family transcriptional regulator [Paraflavitalea sp. CAU 1676]|uniref:AraC family transcriptional regulator n=1 Tax=Paraflavitalea sp. CAU 1676 TaxID=3032598 RepID=UPI0023DA86D5|nr:AraC family transcriptional regulator [Paraflavitalea sp. CAU 1676]MDF2188223.1 AraC family transcriptional regulator [Paraflavitalea sp. CAU 1676]
MEERKTISNEYGSMTSVTWECDGIVLGHGVQTFKELTSFSGSSQKDVVRMHFGMKGNYAFTYKQLGQTYDLIGGHHNIMYSKDFDITVFNKTLKLETFGIQFPTQLFIQFTQNASDSLKRFAADILAGKDVMLSSRWGAIDSPIQQVLQQIIHCKYNDDLKKLFLLSKSIELLVLCAEAYEHTQQEQFVKNKADKEKLIAVRDLINERVQDPPNLTQIARIVGLNEYKLKRGFKEVFNNTVFGYLSEQRLHLAHRYLRDTRKTAAEISYELGYATPQHFSNAFRKKFGITPATARNNP